jgi:hypothetical protein
MSMTLESAGMNPFFGNPNTLNLGQQILGEFHPESLNNVEPYQFDDVQADVEQVFNSEIVETAGNLPAVTPELKDVSVLQLENAPVQQVEQIFHSEIVETAGDLPAVTPELKDVSVLQLENASVQQVEVPAELGDATDSLASICNISAVALILLGVVGLVLAEIQTAAQTSTDSDQVKVSEEKYPRILFYATRIPSYATRILSYATMVAGFALGIYSLYRLNPSANHFNFSKIN